MATAMMNPQDELAAPMTKETLLSETERYKKETLKATQRTLQTLNAAEKTGCETLEALARQDEQIESMVSDLDRMRTDLAYADVVLKKIASPFAFMFQKAKAKAFESSFGSPASWSGPLEKKRTLLPGFKSRFFVLHLSELMYFPSREKNVDMDKLATPEDRLLVNNHTLLEGNRKSREISIQSARKKWILRCEEDNDFLGWYTMLERAVKGIHGPPKSAPKTTIANEAWAGLSSWMPNTRGQDETQQELSVDEAVDQNLDLILNKLNTLGAIAAEQRQAVNIQNKKLDAVSEGIERTDSDVADLKRVHKKLLD